MTALTEKLKEEACLWEKAQEAKESLESKLTTLREQTKKAKVDAMVDFKALRSLLLMHAPSTMAKVLMAA